MFRSPSPLRRRARARPVGPRGRPGDVSSAPPRTSSARPTSSSAKAKMTLLRLAGFSSVRVTSQWQGTGGRADREPSSRSSATSPAPPSSRASRSTSRSTRRARASTPLTPEARELFAAYLTVLKQQLPVGQGRDRRQRAEPQPLLAAAVQPGRHGRGRACVPRAPRPLLRRGQGGRPDDTRLGRRARAARHRPAGNGPRHPLARRVPEGHGRRLSRERPDAAGDGRARLPPLRRLVRAVARHAPPELDDDRPRRLRPADHGRSATAFDGTAAGRHDAARSSTTSSASSRRSRPGKAKAYTGAEPATTKPVDEITQGAYYAAGAAARVLPAERHRDPLLPLAGRAGARRAGSPGVYYADGTPKSSLYAVRDALTRARGGSIARCDGLGLDVTATKVRFPTQARARARIARRAVHVPARLRLGAAGARARRRRARARA